MCRLCNLFSPSCSQLLAHCTQKHPQQEHPNDIVIALQPLLGEPGEMLTESPVKRKRGRPKGSTKKTRQNVSENKDDNTNSAEDIVQRQEEGNKKDGDQQCSLIDGETGDGIPERECRVCHRTFSNKRQIRKHICLVEEEEDEEGGISAGAGAKNLGSLHPEGASSNQTQQKSAGPGHVRDGDLGNFRLQTTNLKEGGLATGSKKAVVSVVLTEDETLPGVSKMVPVEDGSTEAAYIHTQSQPSALIQMPPNDIESDATGCESNSKMDQEPSSDPTPSAAVSRGFQEYSIKQDATNLLQSQLKIFACEFCNKIFKFKHSLVAHLRTHTQEKPFHCPHCDYASAIKANLNVHLRKHTGEKFSCRHCPFNCVSPGHLKVHVERVHLKVKQHCSFCEKKYSDVKNLLKHIEKQHNLKDPDVQQSYQQLRLKTRQGLRQLLYHCPTCNRCFKNQMERQRHLLVHGPQRPFACLLCDHAVTKMAALAAHVRKHLFLYVCCVCDGKFVSSPRLKGHLKESHAELDQEQAFANCINSSFYLTQPGGDMWGKEGKEDTVEGMNEECRINQYGEDDEAKRDRTGDGVGGEEWQDGVGEKHKLAASEDMEPHMEGEQTKSQGESDENVQEMEGETEKEGDLVGPLRDSQQVLHQVVSMETTTPSDGQDEAPVAESSQDSRADPRLPPDQHSTPTSLSPGGISPALSEDQTQENKAHKITHAAQSRDASLSGSASLCDLGVHTHLSSAPPGDGGEATHSERVSEFHQSAFQQVLESLPKSQLDMESFQQLRKIYGDLECQYCGKLFWYKVHYSVHVRTHTKEHAYYCSKCNYSSITKSSLKRHQIQKHSGVLLPCSSPGCQYATPDKYKLQAHLKLHLEQGKSLSCPVCQHSYPEQSLKFHIKTSHPGTLPMRGKGLMVKRAEKCPYCDSYFLKNSSDFQRHIWAHEGLKPYICNICDYAGRSRSNLKTHMNRHSTERPHLCDLCGKKFKYKVTLKSHRLSHTDEGKRYQCSECDFTSVSKPSLLRHLEQHAEFKPFRCAHCLYSCNVAGPLKRHYNMKHPDQKYHNAGPGVPNPDALEHQGGLKCPQCEFVYGTKWELNRHLKSKHSLKVVESTWEVGEAVEAQYVSVEDERQLTEAHVAALQDNVNIQQVTEFSSEAYDAVTSMVAMAPGTVTVIQEVADEQVLGTCSNQLMVMNEEGALTGNQLMVVEDGHGLEALTVLTQADNTHHYIVYVQEQTVEIN
ncbi:zinc finger protein ZFAT [Brachionichthys hirsutus]|uniref:zinc finger protein ZFAT n=1 Tax=Brachionichthys hirsutus TaxID=412623 RepID=UPI0036053395